MKPIFFLLALILLLSSCNREIEKRDYSTFWPSMSNMLDEGDLQVVISTSYMKSRFGYNGDILIQGSFRNSGGCGDLTVDSLNIPRNGEGYFAQGGNDPILSAKKLNTIIGHKVSASLRNCPVFPPFIDSFYVPLLMNPTLSNFDSFSRSAGLPLTWNFEPRNMQHTIVGYVSVDPGFSLNREVPGMPKTRITKKFEFSEQDSTDTLPASFFAGFPPGAYLDITFIRGNEKLVQLSKRKLHLLAENSCTIVAIKMTQ